MIDTRYIPKQGKIIMPFEGAQMDFCASGVDVAFYGGGVGCGKSRMIIMSMAEALMTDGNFRSLVTRRSLQNQKAGGGLVDEFKDVFGDYCTTRQSDSPRISFPGGAYCDLTYVDDTNLERMRERSKGWQYDFIGIDEMTEMPWNIVSYMFTRNRGKSKLFTGKFRGAYNPKRTHWTRIFCDWYIGGDGKLIEERNGSVRYFYVLGETVESVVWGNSKKEVYELCKTDIDEKLKALGKGFNYGHLIKSFAYFEGKVSENKALVGNNPGYIGSVAASGGKASKQLLEVNHNIDIDDDDEAPMPVEKIQECFINDPARNGDKWITVDLAGEGDDNLVALLWDGFHCYKKMVKSETTPRGNATLVSTFAAENGVAQSHIIFDAINGAYFNDYIPDAIPYKSSKKPFGLYKDGALTIKDMCYLRLCQMVCNGTLTFDDELAASMYYHKKTSPRTMRNEILEEFSVVRFDELSNGKKKLWAKKKMNAMLGKHRSMDVADPCAMRMFPCAGIEYGSEVYASVPENSDSDTGSQYSFMEQSNSIYDETVWC